MNTKSIEIQGRSVSTISSAGFDAGNEYMTIILESEEKLARARISNIANILALAEASEAPKLLAICRPYIDAQTIAYKIMNTSEEDKQKSRDRYDAQMMQPTRTVTSAIGQLPDGYFPAVAKALKGKEIAYSRHQFTPTTVGMNDCGELEEQEQETVDYFRLIPMGATASEVERIEL
jgi:hypothetical protein